MSCLKRFLYYLTVLLVIIAFLTENVEARRKILRGRKTITRTYFRSTGIPAWAIVLLTSLGMVIIGGVIYYGMKKVVLDPLTVYVPPPMQHEI